MAKERIISLPVTKGEFKVRGKVKGTTKNNFFEEKTTKSGKPMNLVKFGVQVSEDSTVYLDLNGMARDSVYFYKRPEEKGGKGEVKEVAWNNRKTFNEEGFDLIGIRLGLEKVINEKGQEVNDNKTYTEYDACEKILETLLEDDSLFIRGNIEYSSFQNNKGEVIRGTKFVPSQISGTAKPIDFEAEDFESTSDFQQVIIVTGTRKDDTDPEDVKGIVEAKVVNYSSIEDVEFVCRDQKLFKTLRTKIKPFTSLKVWGVINNKVLVEEVEEDDAWGSKNSFKQVQKTFIRELVITGADPETIDTETYTEKALEEAMSIINANKNAKSEFGEKNDNDWGTGVKSSKVGEDDGWD